MESSGPPSRRGLLVLAAVILLGVEHNAARQEPPVLKEKVSVVNVEIPLRVLQDGVLRPGLRKEDFRLFEDGVPQAINGFSEHRKLLRVQRVSLADGPDTEPPPRYFVLCFRLSELNDSLRSGLDYFFRHILRDSDQLLAFANERSLLLEPQLGPERRRAILQRVLQEEAERARRELETHFQRVRRDIDPNRLRALIENSSQSFTIPQIISFLEAYQGLWQEFKKKFLTADLDKFYNFARHLQQVSGEKWVLSFYQVDMFPNMRIGGATRRLLGELVERLLFEGSAAEQFGRVIARTLEAIDREMNTAGEFPAEQIGKMLIGVNTTYHCFIIPSAHEGSAEDLEFRKAASDLESSLRRISESSGGRVILSGDIGSALHEIEAEEDVYYVLTYEPTNPERVGRVRVELGDPRCRLLYDDRIRSDYIADYLKKRQEQEPVLRLERIFLDGPKLRLEFSSFGMTADKAGQKGQLQVAVTVRDAGERTVYERSRALTAHEPRVSLAVDFSFLPPGRYLFLADVRDLLTGKTAMDVLAADVN
jgi:hypothetical protein